MRENVSIYLEKNRIEAVDYLKGFSISMIVLMHLAFASLNMTSLTHHIVSLGGTGVHVFFLCSGIGLYLSYLKHPVSFNEFIKKRFFKLYIPYIIIVFISFLIPWMYKGDDRIIALLSHVFLFKMFVSAYEESFGAQLWFISTIIQFYFAFIPMCHIREKVQNKKIYFALFLGLSICWWITCYLMGVSDVRIWKSFFLQYIWEFALGFLIAEVLYEGKVIKLETRILILTAILGIMLMAIMALISEQLRLFNDVPGLFGFTSAALLLMKNSNIKKIFLYVSHFSYELFLIHVFVFRVVFHYLRYSSLGIRLFGALMSLIISVVLSYFYNKLCNKIINRAGVVQM